VATSASQTYISKLGFQDRDRSNERHGLACEYLFERMVELELKPKMAKDWIDLINTKIEYAIEKLHKYKKSSYYAKEAKMQESKINDLQKEKELFDMKEFLALQLAQIKTGECINVPIVSQSYRSSFVNGFADVLVGTPWPYPGRRRFLGEVKITKEPAEQVLQQINFYLNYLEPNSESAIDAVYVVTDYDPGDLKRLCVGTKIKVYRLGQVFEQWLANRTNPETEEL
jgi:hypothetical protein